jgi:hypothetical protein
MAAAAITVDDLEPFDFLLYRPKGIYGRIIRFKTGQKIGHVEVYLGRDVLNRVGLLDSLDKANGNTPTHYSTASRDGQGVNFYPVRMTELAYVMRPRDIYAPKIGAQVAAVYRAIQLRGTPYGWLDLLDFCGYHVNGEGVVCSPYATVIGRAARLDLFNGTQARVIRPCDFRQSELLYTYWSDGQDAAFDLEPV